MRGLILPLGSKVKSPAHSQESPHHSQKVACKTSIFHLKLTMKMMFNRVHLWWIHHFWCHPHIKKSPSLRWRLREWAGELPDNITKDKCTNTQTASESLFWVHTPHAVHLRKHYTMRYIHKFGERMIEYHSSRPYVIGAILKSRKINGQLLNRPDRWEL